jgi:histidinol-phosphate/aromatic aminotransferase/cobyric acid decarboxylase-like protein
MAERRVHGGPADSELLALKLDRESVLDFSVNTNPYGPAPLVVAAVRSAPLEQYPDPTGFRARNALSRFLGVGADELALGNGAAELLWTLARTLLRPGASALIVEPTFCEFRSAARASGARVAEWCADPEHGFAISLDAIGERVRVEGSAVVYLCIPNTPTGSVLPADAIAAWAAERPGVSIVLDQSFLALSERAADALVPMPRNVIRVRSLTKEHTIPGVRVGYLIAPPGLVAALEEQRPAWCTSSMAQAAVIAACAERAFVEESCRKVLADRARLAAELVGLGCTTFPSAAGFFLIRTNAARALRDRLLARHRILVRDCTSFRLPEFIRLAARPAEDGARLIRALEEELFRC